MEVVEMDIGLYPWDFGASWRLKRGRRSCDELAGRENVYRVYSVLDWGRDCGPIESGVKHLLGGVVQAIMSPGRSIVASLKNVNGFMAVYTPPDDFIRIDFEQKGVVPEVMLHILEEIVLLLGRHSFNNKIPRMNPSEQSRIGIFLSKEIFKGGVIRIHNAFVHDEVKENSKKDKIRSKPNKNGKRGEARKSQKQLPWIEEEKTEQNAKRRTGNENTCKVIQALKERKKRRGLKVQLLESTM
nr:hypothetical protein [Tanacetum cinerariifolium]